MPRTNSGATGSSRREDHGSSTGVVLARLPAPVRRSRYRWSEWEDGEPRVIWYPKHFQATVTGMRSTIVTHAQKRDIAVACVAHPEHPHAPADVSLAFQFFPGRSFADGPPADLHTR